MFEVECDFVIKKYFKLFHWLLEVIWMVSAKFLSRTRLCEKNNIK